MNLERSSEHDRAVRKVDDLPVGTMLIGRFFDEATALRAAAAFEALGDRRTL